MSNAERASSPNRMASQPNERIDRSSTLSFTFNDRVYQAHPGDTVGSALAAAGLRVLSRSFKYHRPRGLMCCAGQCPNCLVQIGDEPNVRSCMHPVEEGMAVRSQNAWPSLERDALSITGLAGPLMPVGFYYKTFIRPRALWPVYEHVLRNAAGLGKVDFSSIPGGFDKQYLHGGVAVVGAGPAGLSAALAAAEQGAQVLLFDENSEPGGHLRFQASGESDYADLRKAVETSDRIEFYRETTVVGWYKDHWLAAVRGTRLFKMRVQAVVVATGAFETPLVFDNNDLPGVMLGSAVQRLMHLYGVVPGKRAVVVAANDDGWNVAADLHAAGVQVAGVVDARAQSESPHVATLAGAGVPAFFRHTIIEARGKNGVDGATIAPIHALGEVNRKARQNLACDLIAVSTGWAPDAGLAYMAGGKSAYNEARMEMLPEVLPPGVFVAGRASGTHGLKAQRIEGRLAGMDAAAVAGCGAVPEGEERDALQAQKATEEVRTSDLVCVPGSQKRFVCFCEDVTDVDLQTAVGEGYDSIELLKRYSTISMGPCQGKMCSMNTIHLCSRATGRTVQQTGRTTARPPVSPVTLGALAGQNMEPVQVTPVHDWHVEQGARMMVAGLWLRPEHYGDPVSEVQTVRSGVGVMDVSTLGKIELHGPGVPALLERLYINQWNNLRVGRVRYGVMCNDEGVVMDDGVCARLRDDLWYMSTTSSGARSVFEWIQWWTQSGWGEGVHVTLVSDDYAAFNLAGPKSRAVLQQLTDRDLSDKKFPYMRVREVQISGVRCRVLRIGFTGELSYEVHCPSAFGMYVWQALMEAGEAHGIVPFGVEAQRVLRLEKAHVIVGQDTDALSDPLSADLGWAVKMEKDDFLGKRSLARISQKGIQHRLVGFQMAQPEVVPDEGLQIVQRDAHGKQEILGWVTSSKWSPTLKRAIGLCWVPVSLAEQEGAEFTIRMDGAFYEARVHHGAFYDPEGERVRM